MPSPLIQTSFAAGELSPKLHQRSDLDNYDLGVAEATNFFVEISGGLSSRAGLEFITFLPNNENHRLFPFVFGSDLEDTYVVVVQGDKLCLVQDNNPVCKPSVSITGASGGNLEATAHGLETDDIICIDGTGEVTLDSRTFFVTKVNNNTLTLRDFRDNTTVSVPSGVSSGNIHPYITLSLPYSQTDMSELKANQVGLRDFMRFTHKDYPIHNLVRQSATSWTFSEEELGNDVDVPQNLNAAPSASGGAGVVYTITAETADGKESRQAPPAIAENIVNYVNVEGSVRFFCNRVNEARHYNFYRSIVTPDHPTLTHAEQLGFIGKSAAPVKTDNNIVPDFTLTPPIYNDPFTPGAIIDVTVNVVGTNYSRNTSISITDPTGTGFSGFAVLSPSGALNQVIILNGGKNYTNPTVVITDGTGSGASATATVRPSSGTHPRCSALFQQRQIYASSTNKPMTIWGSRIGDFSNFDVSSILTEADSYEFPLDNSEVAPIRHLIPTQAGLIICNDVGIWVLRGDTEGGPVTPLTYSILQISGNGVSNEVAPIKIDQDILFVQSRGGAIRGLAYNQITGLFDGVEVSILGEHLFDRTKVVSTAYAEIPHRLFVIVFDNGTAAFLTYLREQKIYAWSRFTTNGVIKRVMSIRIGDEDRIYMTVERYYHHGGKRTSLERMAIREGKNVEDFLTLDQAGLSTHTFGSVDITFSAVSGGNVTVKASDNAFSGVSPGDVLRAGGAKLTVTSVTNSNEIVCAVVDDFAIYMNNGDVPAPAEAGKWRIDTPTTTSTGHWHLEGETVTVMYDGSFERTVTVTNGTITAPTAATNFAVGREFSKRIKTLPITVSDTVVENRRVSVRDLTLRMYKTCGLKVGNDLNSLYPFGPATLTTDVHHEPMATEFAQGQFWITVDDPCPATILGFAFNIEAGDDPR